MLLQLVLQFRGESLSQYLQLDALEARIRSALLGAESFDGVDSQERSVNIFVYTENPSSTFQRLQPLFERAGQALGFTAAYRAVADNRFEILWPAGTSKFELRFRPDATA
jgi:hypothetical protein